MTIENDKEYAVTSVSLKNRAVSDSIAQAILALEAPTATTRSWLSHAPSWHVSSRVISEKSKEVERQIERIQPYLHWIAEEGTAEIDAESLNRSIAVLRILANGPSPIPMLSVGNDGKPALYMSQGDNSLEAIIDSGKIEYLFTQNDHDTFFEDDLDEDKIPPHLLYLLYCHFAKNGQIIEAE